MHAEANPHETQSDLEVGLERMTESTVFLEVLGRIGLEETHTKDD